jgi:hypothetical protein
VTSAIHRVALLLTCGVLTAATATAQQPSPLLPRPPWDISSTFGPRFEKNKPEPAYFHYGIDYLGQAGDLVRALEGGRIYSIARDHLSGWHVKIAGAATGVRLSYLHLFSNSVPSTPLPLRQSRLGQQVPRDAGSELVSASGALIPSTEPQYFDVTLEVVSDPETGRTDFAIIFWSGPETVAKAFSPTADIDCAPSLGVAEPCRTTNAVATGEAIATVGDSGNTALHPHLHVQLSGNNWHRNPLYSISHRPSAFTVALDSPAPQTGVLMLSQSPVGLRPRVNFAEGLDLNRVDIFVMPANSSVPTVDPVFSFDYRGIPDEEDPLGDHHPFPFQKSIEGGTGIAPIDPCGTNADCAIPTSQIDFMYRWDFSSLTPGNYTVRVSASSVDANETPISHDVGVRITADATPVDSASVSGTAVFVSKFCSHSFEACAQPASGREVCLYNDADLSVTHACSTTDANGTYTIDNLTPGIYWAREFFRVVVSHTLAAGEHRTLGVIAFGGG